MKKFIIVMMIIALGAFVSCSKEVVPTPSYPSSLEGKYVDSKTGSVLEIVGLSANFMVKLPYPSGYGYETWYVRGNLDYDITTGAASFREDKHVGTSKSVVNLQIIQVDPLILSYGWQYESGGVEELILRQGGTLKSAISE